jgi:hypothetical protein
LREPCAVSSSAFFCLAVVIVAVKLPNYNVGRLLSFPHLRAQFSPLLVSGPKLGFVTPLACGGPQDEDIDSTVAAFVTCIERERSEVMPRHLEFSAAGFNGFDDAGGDLLVYICLVLHGAYLSGLELAC